MKILYRISCLLFLGFWMYSCTERIELELNEGDNEKLVVDAWITNEFGPHKVTLTKTTSYFNNENAPRVSGANVVITSENQTTVLTETTDGEYLTPAEFKGEVGKTYQLKIDVEGASYESTATLGRLPKIDSLGYVLDDDEDQTYTVLLYTKELEGKGDHYLFRTFKNGSSVGDTLRNVDFASDDLVDGNEIPGIEIGYETLKKGDMAIFEMLSLSLETHDFFQAIMAQTDFRGGPFDTPPANLPTNISNGAFGFFNASAIERDSVLIE